jgi:capsular polysaccharide biosynthesis protein
VVAARFGEQSPNALVGLSAALRALGRFDEADAVLARATEKFPDDQWVAIGSAQTALERRDWVEAARRWQTVKQRFPHYARAYTGRAEALIESGQFEEAERVLTEAADRFPTDISVAQSLVVLINRRAGAAAHRNEPAEPRLNPKNTVQLTGDLVAQSAATTLPKLQRLPPVRAYREGNGSDPWTDLPPRLITTENEYIRLRDVTLYNIFGCYGLVELSDGRLHTKDWIGAFNIHCSIFIEQQGDDFYRVRDPIPPDAPAPEILSGEYFLPYRLAGTYYFHFLTETLSHIHTALRCWPDTTILIPNCEGFFERIPRQVHIDAVGALAPDAAKLKFLNERIYKVNNLIVPRRWLFGDCDYADEILRRLSPPRSNDANRVVYISRKLANSRRLDNEEALLDAIRQSFSGCKVVHLETMRFAEQIELFYNAKMIISPHGGGLTNLVFCRPGTAVIEILPKDCSCMYRDISQIRSLEYFAYMPAKVDWGAASYQIDVADFVNALAEFCKGVP